MNKKIKKEAELIRLKMKMEIIRTVCPMIMILIQLFIIIELENLLFSDFWRGGASSKSTTICAWASKTCE